MPTAFAPADRPDAKLANAAGGPELLRRSTIAVTAKILVGASLVGLPLALYAVLGNLMSPFVLTMAGLASGMLSLGMHRRGQFEGAIAAQVAGMLFAGLLLALTSTEIADFGLGIALLAPVHAGLLGRSRLMKTSWTLMVAVVAIASVASAGGLFLPSALAELPEYVAPLAFLVVAAMVAIVAHRLCAAFEVQEKAQLNAYRHLIENVQDAVMRFSIDGDSLFISRSAEKLFGCARFELEAKTLIDRIHVLDRPAYLTAFSAANHGGDARSVEIRMRKDGTSSAPHFIWVEAGLSPVIDLESRDERFEVVALFRDISERKDQEAAMKAARRSAEEASEAKSRFLATIGHELRTPLNAIVGFSEMMASGIGGDLTPQHREYADLIHQSGHHLLGVVRMLLDMSRIEAGKFELQTEPFAPEALVEPCLKMIDGMGREKRIRVETDLPKVLPQVIGDERACRQILLNLLSNAIKFSFEGGTVEVSLRRQGMNLAMVVSDNGIGMDGAALEQIGKPFFQVETGLARKFEGTGLGLSIVKGLVDLHGGSLQAVSEPGRGTTMTVLLPLNGPATKIGDSAEITQLHRDLPNTREVSWPDKARRAQ